MKAFGFGKAILDVSKPGSVGIKDAITAASFFDIVLFAELAS